MIINVRHTGIVCNNLKAQIEFYKNLGFTEISRDIEEGAFIEQVTGYEGVKLEWIKMNSPDGFLLELLQYHSHPANYNGQLSPSNQLGCSHLAFTVKDINEVCRLIEKNGGSMVNQPAVSPNGKVKVAYSHDPEGVLMEIVEEL